MSLLNMKKTYKNFQVFSYVTDDCKYRILYNSHKKLCILTSDCWQDIKSILKLIKQTFELNTVLWVSIKITNDDFSEIAYTFIKQGFNNPYITNLNPALENT